MAFPTDCSLKIVTSTLLESPACHWTSLWVSDLPTPTAVKANSSNCSYTHACISLENPDNNGWYKGQKIIPYSNHQGLLLVGDPWWSILRKIARFQRNLKGEVNRIRWWIGYGGNLGMSRLSQDTAFLVEPNWIIVTRVKMSSAWL